MRNVRLLEVFGSLPSEGGMHVNVCSLTLYARDKNKTKDGNQNKIQKVYNYQLLHHYEWIIILCTFVKIDMIDMKLVMLMHLPWADITIVRASKMHSLMGSSLHLGLHSLKE